MAMPLFNHLSETEFKLVLSKVIILGRQLTQAGVTFNGKDQAYLNNSPEIQATLDQKISDSMMQQYEHYFDQNILKSSTKEADPSAPLSKGFLITQGKQKPMTTEQSRILQKVAGRSNDLLKALEQFPSLLQSQSLETEQAKALLELQLMIVESMAKVSKFLLDFSQHSLQQGAVLDEKGLHAEMIRQTEEHQQKYQRKRELQERRGEWKGLGSSLQETIDDIGESVVGLLFGSEEQKEKNSELSLQAIIDQAPEIMDNLNRCMGSNSTDKSTPASNPLKEQGLSR